LRSTLGSALEKKLGLSEGLARAFL